MSKSLPSQGNEPDPLDTSPGSETDLDLSVVIPVYNSAEILAETVAKTTEVLDASPWGYEIILVNDGSQDESWQVCKEEAQARARVTSINLLRNYGQHPAMLCGLRASQGDWVVTIDDDLQNPPSEISKLMAKGAEGHDLVFGEFRKKQHGLYRRLGSIFVSRLNEKLFRKPKSLVISNFRLMRRDVVDRICSYQTSSPYIQGMALLTCGHPGNVTVEHHRRKAGKSNYNLFRILVLMTHILFSYSSFPLHFISSIGLFVALTSMLYGAAFVVRGLYVGAAVQGWTTLVVLLSFLNGITILMISCLGEYVVRLLSQTSAHSSYHVKEVQE
jgi:glycosyltransferase involved in cell wall biosynthesis